MATYILKKGSILYHIKHYGDNKEHEFKMATFYFTKDMVETFGKLMCYKYTLYNNASLSYQETMFKLFADATFLNGTKVFCGEVTDDIKLEPFLTKVGQDNFVDAKQFQERGSEGWFDRPEILPKETEIMLTANCSHKIKIHKGPANLSELCELMFAKK
jgi:hypothetical protein